MMGIGPEEAKRLSYWEYQALLWNWNKRHTLEDDDSDVEAPSAEFVEHRHSMLARMGLGKMVH